MAHILIVDDDPETVDLLDFSLRMQGHDTTHAANGLECVSAVHRDPPDLIVLDHMMPGMGGRIVSLVLRSNPDTASIPIVMVTSRSGDQDVWKGYQVGAAPYVTKPVDLDNLELEINRLLEQSPPGRGPRTSRISPAWGSLVWLRRRRHYAVNMTSMSDPGSVGYSSPRCLPQRGHADDTPARRVRVALAAAALHTTRDVDRAHPAQCMVEAVAAVVQDRERPVSSPHVRVLRRMADKVAAAIPGD